MPEVCGWRRSSRGDGRWPWRWGQARAGGLARAAAELKLKPKAAAVLGPESTGPSARPARPLGGSVRAYDWGQTKAGVPEKSVCNGEGKGIIV